MNVHGICFRHVPRVPYYLWSRAERIAYRRGLRVARQRQVGNARASERETGNKNGLTLFVCPYYGQKSFYFNQHESYATQKKKTDIVQPLVRMPQTTGIIYVILGNSIAGDAYDGYISTANPTEKITQQGQQVFFSAQWLCPRGEYPAVLQAELKCH